MAWAGMRPRRWRWIFLMPLWLPVNLGRVDLAPYPVHPVHLCEFPIVAILKIDVKNYFFRNPFTHASIHVAQGSS